MAAIKKKLSSLKKEIFFKTSECTRFHKNIQKLTCEIKNLELNNGNADVSVPVTAVGVPSGVMKGVNNKLSKTKKHPRSTALPFTDRAGNASALDDESDLVSEFIYRQDDETTLQLSHTSVVQLQQDEASSQQSQDHEHISGTHWPDSYQQQDDTISLMTDCHYQLSVTSARGEGHDNKEEDDDTDDENTTHPASLQQNGEPARADLPSAIPSLGKDHSVDADTLTGGGPLVQFETQSISVDTHSISHTDPVLCTHPLSSKEAPRLLSSAQLSTQSSSQLTSQLSKQFSEPFPLLSLQFSSRSILNELDTKVDAKLIDTKVNSLLSLVSEEEFVEMASPRGNTHRVAIDENIEENASAAVQLSTAPVTDSDQ